MDGIVIFHNFCMVLRQFLFATFHLLRGDNVQYFKLCVVSKISLKINPMLSPYAGKFHILIVSSVVSVVFILFSMAPF
jgi:hypothetical protein